MIALRRAGLAAVGALALAIGLAAPTLAQNGPLILGKPGINQITGDCTAGPGQGSQAITCTKTNGVPLVQTITPQGRLTLTSGTPVMVADVTAATTIYYACYQGNVVPVGAGSFTNLTIGSCQISMGLAAANHLAGSVYDIFGVNSGGTLVLCTGPAWSSATARGTGAGTTELTQTNGGLWTNANSLTNCYGGAAGTTDRGPVAANAGTYLGSFYATANGQTQMQFAPTPAAGGTNNFLALYNAYNQVLTWSMSQNSTASWTVATGTWGPANRAGTGSGLLTRVTYLDGLGQSRAQASYTIGVQPDANNSGMIGVWFDATSGTPGGIVAQVFNSSATGNDLTLAEARNSLISLGLHYAQAGDVRASGAANVTMISVSASANTNGLSVSVPM